MARLQVVAQMITSSRAVSTRIAASNYTTVCANRSRLGSGNQPGLQRLWNPYDAAYEGVTDLSTDQKFAGGQLLLGHTKLESTVRYLGIEVDDALEMAEHTEV
jgi:hypothetical protein